MAKRAAGNHQDIGPARVSPQNPTPPRVLMLVGSTISQRRRSGIHRVALETARALAGLADFDLVRYDGLEGRLRFVDACELDQLFGPGAWPSGVRLQPQARQVGRPFREQLDRPGETWLLVPEVVWHEANGSEVLGRLITSCRDIGVRTACIFYDLIPMKNTVYAGGAALHEAYVNELVRCDLIIPISRHSGLELADLWRERGLEPVPPIVPQLLPDGGFTAGGGDLADATCEGERPTPTIALFGTVEPRKRQVEFLQAMVAGRARSSALARYEVVVIGSLHPYVADAFNALRARHGWIRYLDYADDEVLRDTIRQAEFTAFASDDEGYGLPISESLALGTPCLCANFGAMAEIAAGGGCVAVDVCDAAALEAAAVDLAEQPERLRSLRAEIAARRFQGWDDYGRGLLAAMDSVAPPETPRPVDVARVGQVSALDAVSFAATARADVLALDDPSQRDVLVAEAVRRGWPELLPAWAAPGDLGPAANRVAAERAERERIAMVERVYAKARSASSAGPLTRPVFLRILISTYNRRDFVCANVRWLLQEVVGPASEDVDLVVVDGGSTDGTVRALQDIAHPRFTLVRSPVNVGMLAAWREASHALGAEYIWVIGDDDYLRPEGFRALLAGLRAHPGLPLAFTNISVYHRAELGPQDRVRDLIAEAAPIATGAAPDGLMSVREAAEQTDNLFTAIYAIVWRPDVLAAAYDHAFDQSPFSDLIEAIPCTEMILGRFGACDAFWRGEPAIAANAHNSWSRWRPRWHGVVMPLAFALAREAGVDRVKLQTWADMHLKLFREAMEIAREKALDPGLTPSQLELAQLMLRTDLAPEIAA